MATTFVFALASMTACARQTQTGPACVETDCNVGLAPRDGGATGDGDVAGDGDAAGDGDTGQSDANAGTGSEAGAPPGCRAPDEPGCSTCCLSVGPDACIIRSSLGGDPPWYNRSSSTQGACPAACAPCSPCSTRDEALLRELGERPECDCGIAPGIDPCFLPDSCGCYCARSETLGEACPHVRSGPAPGADG